MIIFIAKIQFYYKILAFLGKSLYFCKTNYIKQFKTTLICYHNKT